MKERSLICVGVMIAVFLALTPFAEANGYSPKKKEPERSSLGLVWVLWPIRLMAQPLPLGLNGDYYFTQGFSVGPLLQMGFTGDLFQLGFTVQAKYTFDIEQIPALKPHIEGGVGFIYADRSRSVARDEDDVGILFPLGFGSSIV